MANDYFRFKEFTVHQGNAAMKVCTDACLFGAWVASVISQNTFRILDIGSGTGLLSLMLAQVTSGNIDAIEISEEASIDALKNFKESPWKDRIQLFNTSIQLFQNDEPYDIVVSNPPFFENDLKSTDTNRNVALHSENLPLKDLFFAASTMLKAEGAFALLIASRREAELEEFATNYNFGIAQKIGVRQTPHHSIFRYMYLLKKEITGDFVEDEIIIKESPAKYSDVFTRLLKEYYLDL